MNFSGCHNRSTYKFATQQREKLNPVPAAAHDSYETYRKNSCLKGTRAELLRKIYSWMTNTTSQSIYVLHGIAGTGKSTVAKTVAEDAARDRVLGASFFFSRDEDRQKSGKSFF